MELSFAANILSVHPMLFFVLFMLCKSCGVILKVVLPNIIVIYYQCKRLAFKKNNFFATFLKIIGSKMCCSNSSGSGHLLNRHIYFQLIQEGFVNRYRNLLKLLEFDWIYHIKSPRQIYSPTVDTFYSHKKTFRDEKTPNFKTLPLWLRAKIMIICCYLIELCARVARTTGPVTI